ncbi:MAG: helix-turn-helix domain-containing protein [Nodosilinea sp.]
MNTNVLVDPNLFYQRQLVELGSLLKLTRESQGQSLEAMATQTLIRCSLLHAIETGDMVKLPEPVYLRGLIRRYGEALTLDGEALASQLFATPQVEKSSWQQSANAQLRPLHLYLTYFFILVAAVGGLSYLLKRNTPEMAVLPPLEPLHSAATTPPSLPPTLNSAKASEASLVSSPKSPIQVEITLTAQSWLRIVADGTTEFEGILQPGDTRLLKADKTLTLRAGNAGGVMVSFNNGKTEVLGKPGTVQEVTYPPDKVISLAD